MKTSIKGVSKALLLGSLPLIAASCTVSEPDAIKGNGTSGRLESISFLTQKLYYFNYNSEGLITEVAAPFADIKIKIEYNGSTPSKIIWQEYEDNYRYELVEEDVWDNIKIGPDGFITSFDATETSYENSNVIEVDRFHSLLAYDTNGHLTYMSDPDGKRPSRYIWEDGCLVSNNLTDEAQYTYEYSDLDNTTLAWTPMWGDAALLFSTGLFGKGPEKMISHVHYKDLEDYEEIDMNFAYKLNSAGQISAMKFNSSDEDMTMTLIYNYR